MKNLLLIGLVALTAACSSSSDNDDAQVSTSGEQASTETSTIAGNSFSLDGKAACEILSVETIAALFKVPADAITSEAYRDKDDHKLCRYELRYSPNKIASLYVNIKYNDRQDKVSNQYSDEMKKALAEGLPVDGFKDKIQTFESVQDLGTQAAYSGNLADNKNLIFRIGEDYFIRLEYGRYEDGKDIGDYKSELTQLAKALLQ